MTADDSDDDKPLLFQFKNSKGPAEAKPCARHEVSSSLEESLEKPNKGFDREDDDKSLASTVELPQIFGLSHNECPSSWEPLLSNLAARIAARKLSPVKVYVKRKKRSEDENGVAKKLKLATCFAGDTRINGGASIVESECREPDGVSGAIDRVKNFGAECGTRNHDDANGGAHLELDAKKIKLTDTQIDDPRLSCDSAHMESLPSKEVGRMASVKEEEEDDQLLLNKLPCPRRNKESTMKDMRRSAKKSAAEGDGCNASVDREEEEDDNLPLSKMSRPKKRKGPAMHENKFSAKKITIKEEDYDTNLNKQHGLKEKSGPIQKLAKPSKVSSNVSQNNVDLLVKRQNDLTQGEQSHLLSIVEEECADDLPLSQMSHSKKWKAPSRTQISSERDVHKEEDSRKDIYDFSTVTEKDSEERAADISGSVPRDNIEDSVSNADDIFLCSPKIEKVTEVKAGVSTKRESVTGGLTCKARAKPLHALLKSLEDIDSEEEEVDDADEEEEEDEDTDDSEDDDYSQVIKHPAVKSKSTRKMPSTTLKVRAVGQSKTRTSISSSKSGKRIVAKEESEEEDEQQEEEDSKKDDEEWEEQEDSEGDDEEWEEEDDDEEYGVSKSNKRKKTITARVKVVREKRARKKVKKVKDVPDAGGGQKWTTLEHNGVIFPPFYQPHGIKMLYEGKPVDLTPEQEEVATMFAVMRETEYVSKPKFLANFWHDWKKLLGPNHVIQKLEDCDFTPIYEWHLAEKEKKKQLSAQEKKAIKEEKLKQEEKYTWAVVDGVKEKVGNFRVEPPALFRGRGEHPKMGKLKRRIYPEDIVINIGAGSPVPECPLLGHRWKEVRHDDTVTWLAYWNDPINPKEQKYVFLAPSSTLKGQSDKEKYEKARVLKDYIEDIRKTYTENFTSSDPTSKQIAVATYLIDRLALRAGNEKDDDEADTVGCCSLKVDHVSLIPPSSLQFDFLGKDSIRYFNVVEVVEPVYAAIGDFRKDKVAGSDLFDRLDTNKLNAHLKNIMPQLTAKVFRTYNASITLDNLLIETDGHVLAEKTAAYQRANKEVAILCNHQRSVSKSHGAQMEKLEGKLAELSDLVDELEKDLERVKKGNLPLKDLDGNPKKIQNPDVLMRKIYQTKQKMERMKLDMTIKEDLKTVALGTSKINYMDPRITVAWCKKHEVPIEKIFNKSLLAKFAWAMDVEMSFRF